MRSRILFVSEHQEDARCISRMLYALPLAIDHVGTLEDARDRLNRNDYDVILTEAALPDGRWLDVLHLAREYPANWRSS